MASDAATLQGLETLMNEFFDGSTNNDRKRQIEELLNNFGLQEGAWRQCIFFINNSKNYYVHMYSFGIFETLVNQKWFGVAGNDKQEIRKFLHEFLATKYKKVPPFIRNKSIKVIVNIGRLDWPMFYPSFFSNVIQLLQTEDTILIGVVTLQMISEEFISPREDLSMTRRLELKETLLQHIPNALNILTELLNTILQKYKRVATTVTPPPSPNHQSPYHSPFHSPRQSPGQRLPASSLLQLSSPLQKQDIINPLIPMDGTSEELCVAIFNCLSQYITWLPLVRFITPALVSKIFHFAEYGCSVAINGGQSSASQVGIYAMNCINEILSKKFIPAEYESFLLQMFQQTFNILQVITKGSSSHSGSILNNMDESYLEKFTEFLHLFVANHLKRFEPNDHFPTVELFALLLKYTSVQQTPEAFVSCLDVWVVVLDYLIDKVQSCITSNFKVAATEKYLPCLHELSVELLKKLKFEDSKEWLEELDMNKLDDDEKDTSQDVYIKNQSETDWEKFLKPCLDVLGKLAELLPEEVFAKCLQVFQSNLDVYFGLAPLIQNEGVTVLNITSEEECQKLHICLLDLTTALRIIGRLSSLFTDEVNYKSRLNQALVLLERLIQGAMFGCFYKTYTLKTAQDYLLNDLNEVHAQAIASIQAYSFWLCKFRSGEHVSEKFESLISSLMDTLLVLFDAQTPPRIQRASAHLLVSITMTIRPHFFLALSQTQKFYENIEIIYQCNSDVQLLVFRALSNALVLPWPVMNDAQQKWDIRTTNHKNFITSLCKEVSAIPDTSVLATNQMELEKWVPIIKKTYHILTDLVETSSGEGTKTRKIMFSSVDIMITLCTKLVDVYITQTEVADKLLSFLLVSIKSLKVQMGAAVVEQIISKLLELLKRDQLLEIVKTGNVSGINTLDKFLKMLEFIVQEPEASFKKLLPSIITYSLEHVMPVLDEHSIPDLRMATLEMFHQLLLNGWRYFFKSNILSKMNGQDVIQHEEQFAAILKAFGQPLLETEIALFKKSIEVLESVNTKYHLYEKALFQTTMLSSFLQVLLNSLIQKSHNLLQEEIIQAIYSMVMSNFDGFFSQFVPYFLMNLSGLTDHQKSTLHENFKKQQDLPSFTSSLLQFIGDLRYCQIINRSLPPGTIQL